MSDNASNNDTMMQSIEHHAAEEGFYFNSSWTHMHCLPHAVHLATLKVTHDM